MTKRRRHAVIIDDERLARRWLRTLLAEAHADTVHVVGEAASVADAVRLIQATDADLVFLDITLGRESGFDLVPHLGSDVDVVFVTAHDAHAVRAFDLNALDYLLKPVEADRLAQTVDRLQQSTPVPADLARVLTADDRLFLNLDGQRTFIRVGDIITLQAAGDDSIAHVAKRAATARTGKSLAEWKARLPERSFVRIHRSTIINLDFVERVEAWSHASYLVYLRGIQTPLKMSRRYGRSLRIELG